MRCPSCGQAFTPKHPRGRFCSDRCRAEGWRAERVSVERARLLEIRRMLQAVLDESARAMREVNQQLDR